MTQVGSSPSHVDETIEWQSQYLDYGFCVLRNLIDELACASAFERARNLVGDRRPTTEWDSVAPGQQHTVYYHGQAPELDELTEDPSLKSVLNTFFKEHGFHFGSSDADDAERRRLALWINPYDERARQRLLPLGHIDSGNPFRGIAIQIALAPTRPFSGNTTFFPGSHREMMRWIDAQKAFDGSWPGGVFQDVHRPFQPWEFVANPGDVVLSHHLLFHSGNPSHADDRSARLSIRAEVFPKHPLSEESWEPDGLSLFARSFAPYHRSNT